MNKFAYKWESCYFHTHSTNIQHLQTQTCQTGTDSCVHIGMHEGTRWRNKHIRYHSHVTVCRNIHHSTLAAHMHTTDGLTCYLGSGWIVRTQVICLSPTLCMEHCAGLHRPLNGGLTSSNTALVWVRGLGEIKKRLCNNFGENFEYKEREKNVHSVVNQFCR